MTRCRIALLAVLALMASSCSGGAVDGEVDDVDVEVPRDADGIETWDLREPPTASDVGLVVESDEAIYSSTSPRRVKVLLPGGRTIDADVTTVSFDNHTSPAGVVDPTGMDLHGPAYERPRMFTQLAVHLEQLGLPGDAAEDWRRAVEESDGRRPVEGGDSTVLGYLEVATGGRYTTSSDRATLTWGIGWSEATMDRARSEASIRPSPAT